MRSQQLAWSIGALALGLAWGLGSPSSGLVWLLGCSIGWLLVHFRIGFSGPFRRLISQRDGRGLYPIAALLGGLIVGMAILLGLEDSLGLSLHLARAPLRWSLVAGAFLFGIGMQLAGRCASGTLASPSPSGGSFPLSLAGLVVGVFAGSLHRPNLEQLTPPGYPPVVLLDRFPLWGAVLLQLGVLLLLVFALHRFARGGRSVPGARRGQLPGVLGLTAALLLLLVVSGEPWKVLWGLGLTGAHAARGFGWDPASSAFWASPSRSALLASPLGWFQHGAVIVDLAVIYGALAAGAWRSAGRSPAPSPLAQPLSYLGGGLLMGYGGFLSYGCNISSFLGGVMSFSLHGWLWLLGALAGSWFWLSLSQKLSRDPPPGG